MDDAWGAAWLYPGDHVRVNRGIYDHHGIVVQSTRQLTRAQHRARTRAWTEPKDIFTRASHFTRFGVDLEVVHYIKGDGEGRIAQTSIAEFLGGGIQQALVVPLDTGLLPAAEICHRAQAHVGLGNYTVTDHNCEHFSTWCATGHWSSNQVADVSNILTVGSFVFKWLSVPALLAHGAASSDKQLDPCTICPTPHPWHYRATGTVEEQALIGSRLRQFENDCSWVESLSWIHINQPPPTELPISKGRRKYGS